MSELMNWFFCLNDHVAQCKTWARAAVKSAEGYPLNKFCVYDGTDEQFCSYIANNGVRVIRHRFSVADECLAANYEDPRTGLGAFLRTDIPELSTELGLLDSPYYLYTDSDVLFQHDPSRLLACKPVTFLAAMEASDADQHFNSGVLWCNAEFFRSSLPRFRRFIVERRFQFSAYDQGALNEFYRSDRGTLAREYNWKPYWGINSDAVIVHFHGPKPDVFRLWQRDRLAFDRRWGPLRSFLRPDTQAAYQHYVTVFESLAGAS